jgi:hypothetical protein
VVTHLTLKTHDLPAFLGGVSMTIKAASDADFRRLLERFMAFYADALLNPHWGESITFSSDNALHISMSSQSLSAGDARAVWQPFIEWLTAQGSAFSTTGLRAGSDLAVGYWDVEGMRQSGSRSIRFDTRPDAPRAHAWWNNDEEEVGIFLYGYDSLWLPKSLLATDARAKLADGLFAASRQMTIRLHFNKGLAGAPDEAIARARDTATNPKVMDAFCLAIIADGGRPRYPGLPAVDDRKHAEDSAKGVADATTTLRALAPDAGSYVSESNFFDAEWRQHYWGANYPRLARVKAKYDPDGLFTVHHGVGSEDWSADGFTRRN